MTTDRLYENGGNNADYARQFPAYAGSERTRIAGVTPLGKLATLKAAREVAAENCHWFRNATVPSEVAEYRQWLALRDCLDACVDYMAERSMVAS